MRLSDRFLPTQEVMDSLRYKDQKKVRILLTGDVIVCIMFVLFSICLIALGKPTTGIPIFFLSLICLASMFITKKGKIMFGSFMTTVVLLLSCFVIAFFTSAQTTPVVSYRTGCFCCAIACFNSMIAFKKRQLVLFMIICEILLLSSTFILHFPEQFMSEPKEWISGLIINTFAIFCSNFLLIAAERDNTEIVEHSEKEHEQAEESLKTITNVLGQIKESMNIGQKLNGAADAASQSVNSIQEVYKYLTEEAEDLDRQSLNIKNASDVVNERSTVMSNSLMEQNRSIMEISSAITQISSNLSQIDLIAGKRRQGMVEVTSLLAQQNELITKIVENVDKVDISSKRISDFVTTVDKIAQQTNLLAMNASIEAAHSGANGKGFSVIAQEIRKLSFETANNAQKVAEILSQNTQVVKETAESVSIFADATKKSEEEIKQTFDSMEEILHGISEMDIGTKEIMNSVNKVVSVSEDNAQIIEEVVNQIANQNAGIESVTTTSASLKEKVSSINEMLPQISYAIDDIHSSAKDNEEVSSRIAGILK